MSDAECERIAAAHQRVEAERGGRDAGWQEQERAAGLPPPPTVTLTLWRPLTLTLPLTLWRPLTLTLTLPLWRTAGGRSSAR